MRTDLIGRTFGRLTIKRILPKFRCLCDCSCGAVGVIKRYHCVIDGNTSSCGCLKLDELRGRATHGDTRTGNRKPGEYHSWANMIARCENPSHPDYKDYGGRGILVCPEWRGSYAQFLADMGRRPTNNHSIDRKRNDDGYEKSNCRWATRMEQAQNRRSTRRISAFGEELTVCEWSTRTGINAGTIKSRINRCGWEPERALSTHVQPKPKLAGPSEENTDAA